VVEAVGVGSSLGMVVRWYSKNLGEEYCCVHLRIEEINMWGLFRCGSGSRLVLPGPVSRAHHLGDANKVVLV
jgi:hypothetical protein